jgi:hypothetical protein
MPKPDSDSDDNTEDDDVIYTARRRGNGNGNGAPTLRTRLFGGRGKADTISTAPGRRGAGETETELDEPVCDPRLFYEILVVKRTR